MGWCGTHSSAPRQEKMAHNCESGNKIPVFIRFVIFHEKSNTFRFSKGTLLHGVSWLDFWLFSSFVCSFVRWVVRYIMNVNTAEKKEKVIPK
jgi:hypothetical protein